MYIYIYIYLYLCVYTIYIKQFSCVPILKIIGWLKVAADKWPAVAIKFQVWKCIHRFGIELFAKIPSKFIFIFNFLAKKPGADSWPAAEEIFYQKSFSVCC